MLDKSTNETAASADSTNVKSVARGQNLPAQKSIEQLAAEQSVQLTGQWERIKKHAGAGKEFWKSDEDFEKWLAELYERRKDHSS